MTELDWHQLIQPSTREAILKGKIPPLIFDLEKPPIRAGDRVVLEWGKGRDPELALTFQYPVRWITVNQVRLSGHEQWQVRYSPPEKATVYMRRGGGSTIDRLRSIDREVPLERDTEVTPIRRATNTVIRERRRIEEELAAHKQRLRRTTNPLTLRLLPAMIEGAEKKLAHLEATDDRERAA
jgi:hypothetical protein